MSLARQKKPRCSVPECQRGTCLTQWYWYVLAWLEMLQRRQRAFGHVNVFTAPHHIAIRCFVGALLFLAELEEARYIRANEAAPYGPLTMYLL